MGRRRGWGFESSWRVILCLALALAAGATGARGASPEVRFDVERTLLDQQRRTLERLLGRERWRQLEEARFQIHLHDLPFTPALSDYPTPHREVGRILLRSLLKASQESVERRLRLEERRDSLLGRPDRAEADVAPRTRLDVSPRFRLDSRPWLGAKLRLRGTRWHFLSHGDIRLGSELDGGNPSVKLAFQDEVRHGFVVYHADHPRHGEAIELRLGFSF